MNGIRLPRNWKSFLRVDSNKTELFHWLAEELVTETGFKELVITRGNLALSNNKLNKTQPIPYNHEKADTRFFVHIKDPVSQSHEVITVVTVDTDVVVIVISCFHGLASTGLKQPWVELGAGINKRWIPIHSLAATLEERCGRYGGLLFWYAFTDCDTVSVSAFGGKGNLTAWTTWQVFHKATPVFARYSKLCYYFDPHEDSV